jgi:hypothetical protein
MSRHFELDIPRLTLSPTMDAGDVMQFQREFREMYLMLPPNVPAAGAAATAATAAGAASAAHQYATLPSAGSAFSIAHASPPPVYVAPAAVSATRYGTLPQLRVAHDSGGGTVPVATAAAAAADAAMRGDSAAYVSVEALSALHVPAGDEPSGSSALPYGALVLHSQTAAAAAAASAAAAAASDDDDDTLTDRGGIVVGDSGASGTSSGAVTVVLRLPTDPTSTA